MITSAGRTIPLALTLLVMGLSPSMVRAQGYSLNPYGNSGYADYREFGTPTYANNPALPGQSRLSGEPLITRPRSNSFSQYLNSDDEGDFESSLGRRGSSTLNAMNRQYNRVSRPNESKQNTEFLERMKQRELDFTNALKEKDPIKRAKLMRDLDNKSLGGSSATKNAKPATASRAPEPNGASRASSSTRAPAPPGLTNSSSNNRGSTPGAPPVAGVGTRRSNTARSTAPARSSTGRTNSSTGGSTSSRPAPDPSTIAVPPPGR